MAPLLEKVNEHYNEKEKIRMLDTIDGYCSNIAVVGFNSSFYDLNLLMNYGFMKEIKKREPQIQIVELCDTKTDKKTEQKQKKLTNKLTKKLKNRLTKKLTKKLKRRIKLKRHSF
jgi:hypothetical protein